jgi:hypothetical protein
MLCSFIITGKFKCLLQKLYKCCLSWHIAVPLGVTDWLDRTGSTKDLCLRGARFRPVQNTDCADRDVSWFSQGVQSKFCCSTARYFATVSLPQCPRTACSELRCFFVHCQTNPVRRLVFRDLNFLQLCCWEFKSSGMWRCVVRRVFPGTSTDCNAVQTSGTAHPTAGRHIPKDLNLHVFAPSDITECQYDITCILFPS